MRHRYANKKLNRDSGHRQSLFKNLIKSLINNEEIKTTESKAKAVRGLFEKLVTKGKEQTLHSRRLVHAFLQDKNTVNKLFDKLAPLFKERKGGYTRIIRLGERKGDQAMMVRLELVEKSAKETPKSDKEVEAKKKTKAEKGVVNRLKKTVKSKTNKKK